MFYNVGMSLSVIRHSVPQRSTLCSFCRLHWTPALRRSLQVISRTKVKRTKVILSQNITSTRDQHRLSHQQQGLNTVCLINKSSTQTMSSTRDQHRLSHQQQGLNTDSLINKSSTQNITSIRAQHRLSRQQGFNTDNLINKGST